MKTVFKLLEQYHDVSLRILCVDDKVCGKDGGVDGTCKVKRVNNKDEEISPLIIQKCVDKDCSKYGCKLCSIKRLMDDGQTNNGQIDDGKSELFDNIGSENGMFFYWRESDIECYYCPTVLYDFIGDESCSKGLTDKIKGWVDDTRNAEFEQISGNVQIVGVRDIRTALLLLSLFKFDMIFIDYLLDKMSDDCEEREYSTQFFEFLSTNYDELADSEVNDDKKDKYHTLAKLKRDVLDNRGPMDKFWIMPITGFNATFITALQNKNVPLISSLWHIENGADPITTPWQFLVRLNRFVELQLSGCVYEIEDLLLALFNTGKGLEQDKKPKCDFYEFQAFMGAEYADFIGRYGARPVIRRDASINGGQNQRNKSVFSTYVWNKFYTENRLLDEEHKRVDRNIKKKLFSVHNLMQCFYQIAATMTEDRNGVLRLREAFRRLRFYLEMNDCYPNRIEKLEFENKMGVIADCIDYLFAERK